MSAQQKRTDSRTAPRHLLVASPHLHGTPYDRQVILLLEHSSRGAVGVLLDHPFQESVRQLRGRRSDPLLQRAGGAAPWLTLPVDLMKWAPGQLDAEWTRGVWLASTASVDEVLAGRDDLWVDLIRQIGRSVLSDALGLQHMPDDPTLN